MSADNRLCVMEWRGEWVVWSGSCSHGYFEPPADYGSRFFKLFDNEKDALDYAREEEGKSYFEGGVTMIGKNEQESALTQEIEHLTQRLQRLLFIGKQFAPIE